MTYIQNVRRAGGGDDEPLLRIHLSLELQVLPHLRSQLGRHVIPLSPQRQLTDFCEDSFEEISTVMTVSVLISHQEQQEGRQTLGGLWFG